MEDDDAFDVDQSLRDSITGLVSALGGIDHGHAYLLGDDALGCLKDIKKWIKFYAAAGKLDALRCIADTNLVPLDLCSILASFTQGHEHDKPKARLALNCLELLVQLTWQIEVDPRVADDAVQLSYETPIKFAQIEYKNAILHHPAANILRPVVRIALPSMAIQRRDRPERDDHIISLAISLFRNLAEISGRSTTAAGMDKDKNEYSRSEAILAFEGSDIFPLLSALAAGAIDEYEKVDCLVIEILYHLVKGVNVEDTLATTAELRSKPLSDLSNMLRKEDVAKRQNKRHSSTRHNRFGTMISVVKENDLRLTVAGQSTLQKDQSHTLDKLDAAKKFRKPIRHAEANELDKPVQLTVEAKAVLKTFVTSFLETSFNPLLISVTRAIERESSRCVDAHKTQLLYVMAWFLKANLHLQTQGKSVDMDFGNVASVFDPRSLVLVLRIMRDASEHKNWTELHAAMECFEQLLRSVHTMTTTKSDEYNEIANNILLNLFYDEQNLDLIVSNVKNYKRQSFGFLDACTSLTHTVLKLLEQFAEDQRLYVKSKRQSKKSANANIQNDDGNSEDEDDPTIPRRVTEKAFQFKAFEQKFVNDHCITTFRNFLDHYPELRPEQIKRVLVFFHRVFVKRKQQIALYRLDICELLSRMVNDEINIPQGTSIRKHLEEFSTYYVSSLVKAFKKTPALYVEILFSKLPNTLYYLQYGEEEVKGQPKRPRAAAELEVKPGRNLEDQIAAVVAALLDDQKSDVLDTMKQIIGNALNEIHTWELEIEARRIMNSDDPEQADLPSRRQTYIMFGSDEFKTIVFKDGKLQLLLKLIGAERIGERDDPESIWVFPAALVPVELENNLRLLKRFIDDPPVFEDGKTGADLLRRKLVRKDESDTDGSLSSNSDESSARPRKSKKKRKRRALDDAELQNRREKRRLADLEKRAMIKSSVRIVDSDDDEDADAEFFERERELRMKMARMAADGTLPDQGTRKRTEKKKKTPQRREETPISVVEMDDADATEPVSQVSQSSVTFDDLENKNRSEDEDDLMPVRKRRFRRAVSISSDSD